MVHFTFKQMHVTVRQFVFTQLLFGTELLWAEATLQSFFFSSVLRQRFALSFVCIFDELGATGNVARGTLEDVS